MAAKVSSNSKAFQPDSDVHITFEDQQKINNFAKLNARLEDLKVELEQNKNDLKQLEEAKDEIELFDEDEQIWSLIGEVFLGNDLSGTQQYLTETQEKTKLEIKDIEHKCADIQEKMSGLKAQLYHRFGNNISLEGDD
ncbi:PFDN4 family protein [Megaselia abdita]